LCRLRRKRRKRRRRVGAAGRLLQHGVAGRRWRRWAHTKCFLCFRHLRRSCTIDNANMPPGKENVSAPKEEKPMEPRHHEVPARFATGDFVVGVRTRHAWRRPLAHRVCPVSLSRTHHALADAHRPTAHCARRRPSSTTPRRRPSSTTPRRRPSRQGAARMHTRCSVHTRTRSRWMHGDADAPARPRVCPPVSLSHARTHSRTHARTHSPTPTVSLSHARAHARTHSPKPTDRPRTVPGGGAAGQPQGREPQGGDQAAPPQGGGQAGKEQHACSTPRTHAHAACTDAACTDAARVDKRTTRPLAHQSARPSPFRTHALADAHRPRTVPGAMERAHRAHRLHEVHRRQLGAGPEDGHRRAREEVGRRRG
jgi:hypothetical protein